MALCRTELIFKENLKRVREQKGVSRYAAAADLTLDRKYYYSLENPTKHMNPSFEKLEQLATYYNVTVSDLLKDNGNILQGS